MNRPIAFDRPETPSHELLRVGWVAEEAREAAETVGEGSMPPRLFVLGRGVFRPIVGAALATATTLTLLALP